MANQDTHSSKVIVAQAIKTLTTGSSNHSETVKFIDHCCVANHCCIKMIAAPELAFNIVTSKETDYILLHAVNYADHSTDGLKRPPKQLV
ncbi:hypothetical protein [Mucilaginibacter pedocola]|uniref:Uncharacterized protein n=1 Tax=Mucilaginibacter pedocola TaxID=1792845 RepID=A0A1S9P8X7_9SPHI|nr:hypothetical protein [Mucilaginibacter pedocola]OOQ57369.1 hypothetical protein BC343_14805 [Mucilaginibacter pedocola]